MKAKWILSIISSVLVLTLVNPAFAADERELKDELIYDVLVDRYFNKKIDNDYEVNALDPASFNGGDFDGMASELLFVKEMGFTALSIGPVFSTATYDGKRVLDYTKFERHFGTKEEFEELVAEIHDQDMKVIVDVPTQQVSEEHVWVAENPDWFTENEDGSLALDTSNLEAQEALISTFTEFSETYEIDGFRLQNADQLDESFVSDFSDAIKDVRDSYILSDREMAEMPGVDAVVLPGVEETLRAAYKNFDQDLTGISSIMEESEDNLIQVDSLIGSRFTADIVEENGFPPTRWTLLLTQLLTMPGIPVVQYGSESAMNGTELPESHQILDLAVDKELVDHITDLTSLRNSSEALRTGELEILHDEDGWLVYKRSNDEETWIIAINNSSVTKNINLPAEVIGEGQEMRGLFESDIIRQEDNGEYRLTQDREIAEVFHVTEETKLNSAYIAVLAIMYVVFMLFLWVVWRKGKQRKADAAKQKANEKTV
ncbi:alpha-amylase [Planococcus antarcticus DSM 14505]|uniref:Alpha-amlyase n=1 Tax=Planococcus antarcticus DSM 14505 TaxID=1185653 RepID=A0A1C7DFY9_9BACL|nr:alpha-amylase family glycosyl hydrolase [Planococcus antarcticus]ANU10327.1 alpha-amlyase [Planococcus antarcticus DSM 14505]EIM06902.1 alpha-amylase [Planococcus antarcticus DSM 14505]